ncbi:gamma-tubulin complex component protein [Radiomyces spectabilis]|uniref:gamma-tubulin complex component protein n=1 Tax=Radiomyces spectabilis TaxID=64574 RepID=UPI00222014CB|nr:gamma-tubulin complex component protein [Radiomyces spectabilis]KAI8373225.1 gamma-tubulin complex component protein [Radiomyces spectabilis]
MTMDVDMHGFELPFGMSLLSLLYDEIQTFDFDSSGSSSFYKEICLALLCHTSVPFFRMLNQWLGLEHHQAGDRLLSGLEYSPLIDPFEEFFIEDTIHPFAGALSSAPSIPRHMEYIGHYQIRKGNCLPRFVNKEQAFAILGAGNSLRLLQQCQKDHPLLNAHYLQETGSSNSIDDLRLSWILTDGEATSHLRKLYGFYEILRHYSRDRLRVDELPLHMDVCSVDSRDEQISDHLSIGSRSTDERSMEINETMHLPSLSPLPQEEFCSEFSRTLEKIMKYHTMSRKDSADNIIDYAIPMLDTIIEQSLHQPLQIWCPLLNNSAMSLLLNQFGLEDHLSLLKRYFLFGDDLFVAGLCNVLLPTGSDDDNVETGFPISRQDTWPPKLTQLNTSLRAVILDAVSQIPEIERRRICSSVQSERPTLDIEDILTFSIREKNGVNGWMNPYALDFLCLSYEANYPLNVVITEQVLEKYNRVFSFLLRITKVTTATKRLYEMFRGRRWYQPATGQALHRFRFGMEQFITSLCEYIFQIAIQATWSTFMQRLDKMKAFNNDQDSTASLDFFYMMDPITLSIYHDYILDRILFQCFLKRSQQSILHVLNSVFKDILSFSVAVEEYHRTNSTGPKAQEQEQKMMQRCETIFDSFMKHAKTFVKILQLLDDKGIGRLGNMMYSMNNSKQGIFGDIHEQAEAKAGIGGFVKELLTRLNFNGVYEL